MGNDANNLVPRVFFLPGARVKVCEGGTYVDGPKSLFKYGEERSTACDCAHEEKTNFEGITGNGCFDRGKSGKIVSKRF